MEPDSPKRNQFKVEYGGGNAGVVLQQLLKSIQDTSNVRWFRFELISDETVTFTDEIPTWDLDMGEDGKNRQTSRSVVEFEDGSSAFRLAKLMNSLDEFLPTSEIRDNLPDELDEDSLSQILWDLSERGILEKRKYSRDKRMREYRITPVGRASVELADDG